MPTTDILCDAAIARIAHGLLDRSLPKAEWTHAAHFAAALWLVPAGRASEMPDLIRAYNTATGVANTATSGYHETITQASLAVARGAGGGGRCAAGQCPRRADGDALRPLGLAVRLLVARAPVLARSAHRMGRAGSGVL